MPPKDLEDAADYWLNIKTAVSENRIESGYFYRESDHRKFHVRPKARNALDVTENPNGGTAKKYCYWFNREYIKQIVDTEERQS